VSPEAVRKIREATKEQRSFYQASELKE
jgi:hypothetical protein